MIYRYEVKNNGSEDILYLYLDIKSEFSKELTNSNDINDLSRRTKNFIINNDIKFNGRKVYLIIDGIIVKTVDISKVLNTAKNNPSYSNKEFLVNIKLIDNSFIEVTLEKYLLGILSSIYNESIHNETIKCISILYRTYAYKEMFENNYIDHSNGFFEYQDISNFKLQWSDKYDFIYNNLLNCIAETDCLFLNYKGNYILPFIHYCNNGNTFSNSKYPYLTGVSSLWDLACPNNKEIIDYSYSEFSKLTNNTINNQSKIDIKELDTNNQIIKISINNKLYTGEELKRLLSLKSLNFNIILYNKFIRIITFGFGNFMGLSIYGANELSIDGIDYPNILKYYFPHTELNKYIEKTSSIS